ncbi:efflux RND transporter periplasmic adaptor subunit [Burkholderia sp. Ac-20353]|uniref:efflux RND transporter periplasmic adaptor subunit n=1 Tax=Burkholderia sp. Ac-20353 TaxID=2703894 RepID=UPI00197B763F|nr:efflux RND transporter periplasmic adaptor subunit [Burkholderia sp. Ac-20353]MBN3791057.1 HlyD family efflux transporter periplasmic adaptor subunit [Burkholderia sp. Ac-20353]
MSDTTETQVIDTRGAVRKKRLTITAAAVILVGAGLGAWHVVSDGATRTTDDAYVNGHVAQVTPQVAGVVTRVFADNTDRVAAGAPLVEIDSTDARIELAAADAQLAQAVRTARGLFAANARYDADVKLRETELAKVKVDFEARRALADTGAVTGEDVRHARDNVSVAQAALAAAKEQRRQAHALVDGMTVESHPTVKAASARVHAAEVTLARTVVRAPVGGMIAQRTVQLGRRVAPGDRMMAVVPLERLWVDANFKEVQLDGVCPGQRATVTADIYGNSIVYHGHVEDVEAGSGASFALLPAQNATGNWIKVVQRVPVRIAIAPADLAAHPLRIGMSTEVKIHADACDPKRVASHDRRVDDAASVYAAEEQHADERIKAIVAANLGGDQ